MELPEVSWADYISTALVQVPIQSVFMLLGNCSSFRKDIWQNYEVFIGKPNAKNNDNNSGSDTIHR